MATIRTFEVTASRAQREALTEMGAPANLGDNPAYLAVDPSRTRLFAANETDGAQGGVTAATIDQGTGALTLVEHEPTRGDTPRDFDVDPACRYLVVANQASDNLAVFEIAATGLTPVGEVVTGANSPAAAQFVYLP